jgi:hypothetical protein
MFDRQQKGRISMDLDGKLMYTSLILYCWFGSLRNKYFK